MKTENTDQSIRVAINDLMLQSSFMQNTGLMNGKMGLVVFYCHMAEAEGKQIYLDNAQRLLLEIIGKKTYHNNFDFENGLAGIAWGLEHLIEKEFIDLGGNSIPDQLNGHLFNYFLSQHTISEIGVTNGFLGFALYFLKRVENFSSGEDDIQNMRNKEILVHITDHIDEVLQDNIYDIFDESSDWKITWDLPVVLYVIGRLHFYRVFFFKTERIMTKLISYMNDGQYVPQKHSNRLLLEFALRSVSAIFETSISDTIEEVLFRLNQDISRSKIEEEICPANNGLLNGAAGIILIYRLLYGITKEKIHYEEAGYWKNYCKEMQAHKESTSDLGLFRGIAGQFFASEIIERNSFEQYD